MGLFLFLIFVFWLYNYWRFTGKRKSYKDMVIVAEIRHARLNSEQSALELASAYMQFQRYADAYTIFLAVISQYPYSVNVSDIHLNMSFCQKPLPWSNGLKNHNMSYWHNFFLVRLGGRRKPMISQDLLIETDNYEINSHR